MGGEQKKMVVIGVVNQVKLIVRLCLCVQTHAN